MYEAKSIQRYIFRSGKLKDVIAASERLDQLIDTNDNSVLSKVLKRLPEIAADLHFSRRKGGAFYVYSDRQDALIILRKVWTLTVQQFFPDMDFIDGHGIGDNLIDAIADNHKALAASRNNPVVKMPLFLSNMFLSARTANPTVPFSTIIKQKDKEIDADTNINRHTYELMKVENSHYKQYLYKKFIDVESYPDAIFPLDLSASGDSDDMTSKFPYHSNKNDLALIHIDGNRIGLLLMNIKEHIKKANNSDYENIFRKFSNALCDSTECAAKHATSLLIQKLPEDERKIIPMRPLVMGGDDISLFCRADLAVEYARDFCLAFQKETEKNLSLLYEKYQYLNLKSHLPKSLSASGGLIFQKATQPFTASHQIVEELCHKAKEITKVNVIDGVGVPALAFMRISTMQDDHFKQLFANSYMTSISDAEGNNCSLVTSIGNYIVTNKGDKSNYSHPNLDDLLDIVQQIYSSKDTAFVGLFRKVLSELHHNNLYEAKRLMARAEQLANNDENSVFTNIEKRFASIRGKKSIHNNLWWLWHLNNKDATQLETILDDIIMLVKYTGEDL